MNQLINVVFKMWSISKKEYYSAFKKEQGYEQSDTIFLCLNVCFKLSWVGLVSLMVTVYFMRNYKPFSW